MLQATDDGNDGVDGMVFEITDTDLQTADAYEEDCYVRTTVTLGQEKHHG